MNAAEYIALAAVILTGAGALIYTGGLKRKVEDSDKRIDESEKRTRDLIDARDKLIDSNQKNITDRLVGLDSLMKERMDRFEKQFDRFLDSHSGPK